MRPEEIILNLKEDFALLGDWEEKFSYIIDLGQRLPPFPENEKTDDRLVNGCVSRVWIMPATGSTPQNVQFLADSDALITKGLVALLLSVVNQQPAQTILNLDFNFINELGLGHHLSPNRVNGLWSMIRKIRDLASALKS